MVSAESSSSGTETKEPLIFAEAPAIPTDFSDEENHFEHEEVVIAELPPLSNEDESEMALPSEAKLLAEELLPEPEDLTVRLKKWITGYGVSLVFHSMLITLAALIVYQEQVFDWHDSIESSVSDGLGPLGAAGGLEPMMPVQLELKTDSAFAPWEGAAYQSVLTNSGQGGDTQGSGDGGVGFFGTRSRGHSFVFVVDVSGSMTARYQEPDPKDPRVKRSTTRWKKAQEELLSAIEAMSEDQSFSVILYNDLHLPMMEDGKILGLLPATERNKRRVEFWLNSISAGGGTNPVESIKYALSMKPDVVFLLTDGEIPPESREVSRMYNRRETVIHTTCIGAPQNDLLQLIASDHRGQFRAVTGEGMMTSPEGVTLQIYLSSSDNLRLKSSRLGKHYDRIRKLMLEDRVVFQTPNTHSTLTLHNVLSSAEEFQSELQLLLQQLNVEGDAGLKHAIHPGRLGVGVKLGEDQPIPTEDMQREAIERKQTVEQLLRTEVSDVNLKSLPQVVKTIYLFGDIETKQQVSAALEVFNLFHGSRIKILDGDTFVREQR